MQQIASWLASSKDYTNGVSLFNEFGGSVFYKQLFASGKTPYNEKKLAEELQKLCPDQSQKEEKPIIPVKNIKAFADEKQTADYPKYLRIKEDIANLYLQANRAKQTINQSKNENVLLATALLLKKLKKSISDKYMLIDFFDENGSFPLSEQPKQAPTVTDFPKAVQLLRQSNSKAKRRLLSDNCKDKAATQKLIDTNTALIDSYLIKIGRK